MRKRLIYTGALVIAVTAVMVCVLLAFRLSNHTGFISSAPDDPAAWVSITPAVTLAGHLIHPGVFLTNPAGDVTAMYRDVVDFNFPGRREIVLTLTRGEEQSNVRALLYILEPARIVEREAGITPGSLRTLDFINNADILEPGAEFSIQFLTEISGLDLSVPNWHDIRLNFNGISFTSTLRITDTTPPSAVAVHVTIHQGQSVSPGEFVRDIIDTTPVTVVYQNGQGPDVFATGDHPVTLVLEDAYGNQAVISSKLTVLPNLTPPVIRGAQDLEVMLGGTVMYRRGVTAEDSHGNQLSFTIDNTQVDLNTPGEYTALYRAEDAVGNYIERAITVTVLHVEEEMLEEMIRPIISRIIRDGMTEREMAKAIFDWVRANIGYTSEAPRETVFDGAYRALTNRSGDCFTFYAISELLLNWVGIPNMRVSRIEGTPTRHYWNLVNADGEGWHHFDTTPTQVPGLDRFMFTDSTADEYTSIMREQANTRDYYTYDKSLYPEVMP
jgi:hypothetical protein